MKKHSPFSKAIHLKDIQQVRKFTGDYILKTKKSELVIDTQIIDANSLLKLDNVLDVIKGRDSIKHGLSLSF